MARKHHGSHFTNRVSDGVRWSILFMFPALILPKTRLEFTSDNTGYVAKWRFSELVYTTFVLVIGTWKPVP